MSILQTNPQEIAEAKKKADKNWILTAYDKTSADSESPITTNQGLAGLATDNFTHKVTQNSPTDQTNPQQSTTGQGKTLHSLPEGTTPEERARIEEERRKPLAEKQKQPGKDHTARFAPEDFDINWQEYGDTGSSSTGDTGTDRYSLTKRTRQTIDGWLRKRPDITDEQRQEVLDQLDQSDDTAYQLAAGKWFATGKVRLPDDTEKIQQAVEVAQRAKVDPLMRLSQ